jgi:Fe-coproporphyrin III synthase
MIQRISNRLRRLNAKYWPTHVFQGPKWLVLGVNNACNLHCKMCDVGTQYEESNFFKNLVGSKPVHMPLELFRNIVDQAARFYPNTKIGYAFTEPLIYSHLEASLRYVKSKNLFTAITTNGLGLKKWAPVMHEVGLDEINISLDGPATVHNFIRGNEASFSKAVEGIEALRALKGKAAINVYCVITEWNADLLTDFLNELKPYAITKVGFMHSNFTPQHIADLHNAEFGATYPATPSNVSDTNNSAIDIKKLTETIREVRENKWSFPVHFFPDIPSSEALERYYRQPEVFIGKRCLDIFSTIMIKSNGDVIPAHGRCFNLTVGNLYKQNLPEIWNSAIIVKFRKTVTSHGGLLPACSRCCSSFV